MTGKKEKMGEKRGKKLAIAFALILAVSIFSISLAAAAGSECNLWCKIVYIFTGKISTTGDITKTITGNAINSPADISGLALWLKADAITGLSDGASVASWTDSSGNGRNAVQTIGQPVYKTNILNGKPVVRFNPSQQLAVSNNFAAPVSVIYVGHLTGGANQRLFGGVNNNWLLGFWGGHMRVAHFGSWVSDPNGPAADTDWYTYTALISGSNSKVYENGTLFADSSTGQGPNGITLNGYNSDGVGGETSDGEIAEVIVYNRVITDAERQDVEAYLNNKYFAAAPVEIPTCGSGDTANILSYWKGEDTADSVDSNPGTNINGVAFNPGKVGNAFTFNGQNSIIDVGNSASLNWPYTDPLTVEMWFKTPGYGANSINTFISKCQMYANYNGWLIYGTGDRIMFSYGSSYSSDQALSVSISDNFRDNIWHHLIVTYDGSNNANNIIFYVDGALQVKSVDDNRGVSQFSTLVPLVLGGRSDGNSGWNFNGQIDEVAIYNRALSLQDVQAHLSRSSAGNHYCGAAPQAACPDGMVSYWQAEGNADDKLGVNNGTAQGGLTYATGKLGQAFSLDGNDDYISVPNSNSFGFTSDSNYSAFAWVNLTASKSQTIVFMTRPADAQANTYFWLFEVDANNKINLIPMGHNLQQDYITSNAPIELNKFNFIGFTYKGGERNVTLYINGIADNSKISNVITNIPATGTFDHSLGAAIWPGWAWYDYAKGAIDEVAIFNTTLSASEIQSLFLKSSAGQSYCGAAPQPTCSDTIKNQDETDVDCGGAICGKCNIGKICAANSDCVTNVCFNGLCQAAAPQAACPGGMVSYWQAENNANDKLGVNNGTAQGGLTYATGKLGQAFSFNGASSYMGIADAATTGISGNDFVSSGGFTASFWIRPTSWSGDAMIITKGNDHVTSDWSITVDWYGQYLSFFTSSSGGQRDRFRDTLNINSRLPVGQWSYVTFTMVPQSGSSAKFYVNAIDVSNDFSWADGTGNNIWMDTNGPFGISANAGGFGYVNALIDEVAIYNRTLTADEISTQFIRSSAGQSYCAAAPVCGNSVVEAGEQCDDGNVVSGDGCSSTCIIEAGCPGGMISYWKGEGNANDVLGINNGTPQGSLSYAPGKVAGGQAFSLNGNGDYISVQSPVNIPTGNSPYAIEAWFYPNSVGAKGILGYGNYGAGNQVNALRLLDGCSNIGFRHYWWGNDLDVCTNNPPGAWYHVVASFDGTTRSIYLNGVKIASDQPTGHSATNSNFAVGKTAGGEYFDGLLDGVAIYNRALTDGGCSLGQTCGGEIAIHYNNGTGKDYCAAGGAPQPTCSDTIKNQDETDVDCGGAICGKCNIGKICSANSDCVTNVCFNGLCQAGAPQVGCPEGMVSYWKGEGNANDAVGTSDGTTPLGMSYVAGQVGQAFSLDNTLYQYIDVPQAQFNFGYDSPFSIVAWIYCKENCQGASIFNRQGTDEPWTGYDLSLSNQGYGENSVIFDMQPNWAYVVTTSPVSSNQWYQVVATYDGSRDINGMKIYVNGTNQDTINFGYSPTEDFTNSLDPYIGARATDSTVSPFGGYIDEVAIFNKTLSATEIQSLYSRSSAGQSYCGPVCGNGAVETGEQCDDGNTVSGDGCSATCTIEAACPEGMVSYWQGEGNANDKLGVNNGTAQGGLTYATGKLRQAFSLDGNDDYIDITTNNFAAGNSPFSVEAWIWMQEADPDATEYILTYGTQEDNQGYLLAVYNGQSIGGGWWNYGNYVEVSYPMQTWFHVVETYDGTDSKIYYNGALISTTNLPLANTQPGIMHHIGMRKYYGEGENQFNGRIDEVAVYNRALTQAEITAHAASTTGYCAAAQGPVCGNGAVETGEQCDDGNNFDCDGCKGDCSRTDNVCGDGIIECSEQCDGTDLNGQTCSSVYGPYDGTLTCDNQCKFNIAGCYKLPLCAYNEGQITETGIYSINACMENSLGNITCKNQTVKVDLTAPTTTASLSGDMINGKYDKSATVTLNADDLGSGISKTYYCSDGDNSCNPGTIYSAPFLLERQGTNYARFYSVDNAGNSESAKFIMAEVNKCIDSDADGYGTEGNTEGCSYPQIDCNDNDNSVNPGMQEVCNGIDDNCDGQIDENDVSSPVTTDDYGYNGQWITSDAFVTLLATDDCVGVKKTEYCIGTPGCVPDTVGTSISITSDGIYYINYRSIDNRGNTEALKPIIIKIDKTAPIAPVLSSLPQWSTTGNVDLSWTASDASISGLDRYEVYRSSSTQEFTKVSENLQTLAFTDTGLADGAYTFKIKVYDNAGNSAESNIVSITVDTANPSVQIINPLNSQMLTATSVSVTANYANDNLVNCVAKLDSNDAVDMNGDNQISGAATYTFSGVSQGLHEFTVTCTDEAGNSASDYARDVMVDSIKPLTTSLFISNDWQTNKPALIDLTCSDPEPGSGCGKTYYCIDESNSCEPGLEYVSSLSLNHEGTKYVRFYSTDRAGNSEAANLNSQIVKIDTVMPTITDDYAYSGQWIKTNQLVTLSPFDATSGIKEVRYCTDIGCTPSDIITSPYQLSYTSDQDTVVRYDASDNAGLSSSGQYNVKLDKTAPETTDDNAFNNIWTNFVQKTITLSATDNLAGVNKIDYSINGAPYTSLNPITQLNFAADGVYNLDYYATDNANNQESGKSTTIKLDATAPLINVTVTPKSWTECSAGGFFFWLVFFIDGGQVTYPLVHGCAEINADIDASISGLNNYQIKLYDQNNNLAAQSTNSALDFNFVTDMASYKIVVEALDNANNYGTKALMIYEDDDEDLVPDMLDLCPTIKPAVDANKDGCPDEPGVPSTAWEKCISIYTGSALTSIYPIDALNIFGGTINKNWQTWYGFNSSLNNAINVISYINIDMNDHNKITQCLFDLNYIDSMKERGQKCCGNRKNRYNCIDKDVKIQATNTTGRNDNQMIESWKLDLDDGSKIRAQESYNAYQGKSIINIAYENDLEEDACSHVCDITKRSCSNSCGSNGRLCSTACDNTKGSCNTNCNNAQQSCSNSCNALPKSQQKQCNTNCNNAQQSCSNSCDNTERTCSNSCDNTERTCSNSCDNTERTCKDACRDDNNFNIHQDYIGMKTLSLYDILKMIGYA
jgi:cysteine-rich repeat protein